MSLNKEALQRKQTRASSRSVSWRGERTERGKQKEEGARIKRRQEDKRERGCKTRKDMEEMKGADGGSEKKLLLHYGALGYNAL